MGTDRARHRMSVTFTTSVRLVGTTATGLWIPPAAVAELSDKRRPPVYVTVEGYTYRSTVAPYGDEFFIPLNRENRKAAGCEAGDEVEVTLRLDEDPRVIVPPDDLSTALADEPLAQKMFQRLSYSHQREYVQWIEGAKRPETRQRRIARAVEMLKEGKTQR